MPFLNTPVFFSLFRAVAPQRLCRLSRPHSLNSSSVSGASRAVSAETSFSSVRPKIIESLDTDSVEHTRFSAASDMPTVPRSIADRLFRADAYHLRKLFLRIAAASRA